jgi:hypothetical protein
MNDCRLWLAVALVVSSQVSSRVSSPFDAARASLSTPRALIDIDMGRLKGEPAKLAISDQGVVFLRTVERDTWGNERGRNYLLNLETGKAEAVAEEPPWAMLYWSWKAGIAAPGLPALKLDVEVVQGGSLATGSATGGSGSPYQSDPSQTQAGKDWSSYQKVVTTTLKLRGVQVWQGKNVPFAPGLTFGWAPAPLAALAFVDDKKRLTLVDGNQRLRQVAGATDALLPAWTPDATRILYLQKKGGKKFALMAVDVQ